MPIVLAMCLTPIAFFTARAAESYRVDKKNAFLLNCLLVFMVVAFYVFCFLINAEPFDLPTEYSKAYMFFSGRYFTYACVIYVFSPFMWVITIHFIRLVLRSLRVRKNAMIKRDKDFRYYREDMDKIAPGMILFTREMDVDMRRSISSGVLKLKLSGYVKEHGQHYTCTDKTTEQLSASEKMLLELVKTGSFNAAAYRRALETETLEGKYIIRNRGGVLLRLLRILLAVCIPFLCFAGSDWLDCYVHDNYTVYPYLTEEEDGPYFLLSRHEDIKKLMSESIEKLMSGSVDEIPLAHGRFVKADQFQYSVVRKAFALNFLVLLSIGAVFLSGFISLYIIIEQIRFFNKNYRRTKKGNVLLSKAYALKNYLKEYSLIEERSERELILWEYYLVYAVALDINEHIEDEVMQKLVNEIQII